MSPHLTIHESLTESPCRPALIWADGIEAPTPSSSLPAPLAALVDRAAAQGESLWPAGTKGRVRDMLRHGKYKPSGRSKPASEFLLKAAASGRFPAINAPVDVNNYVSLASGLPGSILDADLTGERLLLRRGRPGERYVFNPSGQEIDLQDLLLVARESGDAGDGEPCGNPVKDAMITKIRQTTRRVVAVLYAPADESAESVSGWARQYAALLAEWAGAESTGFEVL